MFKACARPNVEAKGSFPFSSSLYVLRITSQGALLGMCEASSGQSGCFPSPLAAAARKLAGSEVIDCSVSHRPQPRDVTLFKPPCRLITALMPECPTFNMLSFVFSYSFLSPMSCPFFSSTQRQALTPYTPALDLFLME